MKVTPIFSLLLLYTSISFALPNEGDSLIAELNTAIKQVKVYDNLKLQEIHKLHDLLNQNPATDLNIQYSIYLKLYEEYKYYNYDSALFYANRLQNAGQIKNSPSVLIASKLKSVFILLSGGMFKETFDSLQAISITDAADSVKGEYYTLMGITYYNLADYNSDNHSTPFYNNKANHYLDSAITFYGPNSFEHVYYSALKFLKKGSADSALANLNLLMKRNDLSHHQIALATSTIGGILISQGHEEQAKPYLIQASIADIKSSTKETLALLTLAGIVYKEGNIEEAVLYIEKANADASFYNARLRKVQVGAILPLIEGGMIATIKNQKEKLQAFLIALSILVLLLAGFAVIIRNQVKKLSIAKQSLSDANSRLQKLNQELSEANDVKQKYNTQLQLINHQLSEANKIKEEYIGYFFNLDTEFLGRIEKLVTSIDKKLTERKWEEIRLLLKSVDIKKEKDELLKNFDKVFLKLFPNFVAQFNTLFTEEDKVILKEDQLLNAELRIFALIRLGITENEKIAEILDYSINTIYAKKTKIRSKTIINKEELERKLVEITTLNL